MLNNAARIHDTYFINQSRDYGQVVRDPDHGGAGLAAELLRLIEDLPLDRHIKSRRRLVGDYQVRLVQKRDCDRHTLAHAARKLMRVGLQSLVGRRNTHLAQRIAGALARFVLRDGFIMGEDRLNHLRINPEYRIERHHRILKNHGDPIATQLLHLFIIQTDKVMPVEQDLATDHFTWGIYKA